MASAYSISVSSCRTLDKTATSALVVYHGGEAVFVRCPGEPAQEMAVLQDLDLQEVCAHPPSLDGGFGE